MLAVSSLALPYVASRWFASNQGINTLMRGFSGKYSGPALKAATQLAVQSAEAGAQ
ncbi:MAG TPA: hypothetical protein VJX71_06860 [Methylomirabilota bacterium]|nr:hypothetical protein [Methylomirabilota bacterium]